MKLLVITLVATLASVNVWSILKLDSKLQISREQNSQLRRERNMYDSLYRSANTRLYQFQDSLNKHCICK